MGDVFVTFTEYLMGQEEEEKSFTYLPVSVHCSPHWRGEMGQYDEARKPRKGTQEGTRAGCSSQGHPSMAHLRQPGPASYSDHLRKLPSHYPSGITPLTKSASLGGWRGAAVAAGLTTSMAGSSPVYPGAAASSCSPRKERGARPQERALRLRRKHTVKCEQPL